MYITIIEGFHFDTRYRKYPYVCRRTKLPGRGVHSEEVREISSQRRSCEFVVKEEVVSLYCILAWTSKK